MTRSLQGREDVNDLWVLTACHRPHLDLLRKAHASLGGMVPAARVVVVANGDNPPTQPELPDATVIPGPDVRSVAGWWNTGMDWIDTHGGGHVLFLDSDATTTPETVQAMVDAVETLGLAYVGVDRWGVLSAGGTWVRTDPGPYRDLRWRPSGYCFILSASCGVRPDPRYTHWYLDDDMELQALTAGGVGMVQGYVTHPDDQLWSEDTAAKRECDRALFVGKWGREAWIGAA